MQCAACDETLERDARFCATCGSASATVSPSIRRCASCGSELDRGVGNRFCGNCGASVADAKLSAAPVAGSEPSYLQTDYSARIPGQRGTLRAEAPDRDWNRGQSVRNRPTAITVICILGFIGAVLVIPLYMIAMVALSSLDLGVGPWHVFYTGLSFVVGLACMIGLWRMKKWAAYTYTAFVAVNQVVLVAAGLWTIVALLIPAVVVIVALKYSPRMT
jgi:hypothetical protein